ncbi:MAG: rhodanese-like domain-containing protein [Flavobacteriaceae bacterium]|nr:rhodanese-like domain-containing protein [Flavobacteriaceae bacterium]
MGFLDFFGNKKKKIADFQSRNAIVLDVRTKKEYNRGAIPNSKHIPLDILSTKISEVKNWNKPVITCCESGGRSAMAARLLRTNGVEVINGGGWNSLLKKM